MEIDLTLLALIIVGLFLFSHEAHDSVGLNLVVGITILIKVLMWYIFFSLLSDGCVCLCRRVRQLWRQEEETAAYEEERQQLHQELKKLQRAEEQSQLEIRSLQEELQQLRSQAQLQEQLHRDTVQCQAAHEEELAFLRQKSQQLLSDLKQSELEVGSLEEELKKLRIRAENWEQLRFYTLESQITQEELSFLKQDRQQLVSDLNQSRLEIHSLQEELQQLSNQAELCQNLHWFTLQWHTEQEEELAFLRQDSQQLLSAQEQCRQEVCSQQEELQQLSSQAQHCQKLHWDREQMLAMKEQLAVCKAELAFFKQNRQQLVSDLNQSRQEVRSFQERVQQLSRQAQHCWKLHWVSEQTLGVMEEELADCKVELVSFEGELGKISEQQQDVNRMRTNRSPRAEGARPEPQAPLEDGSVQG